MEDGASAPTPAQAAPGATVAAANARTTTAQPAVTVTDSADTSTGTAHKGDANSSGDAADGGAGGNGRDHASGPSLASGLRRTGSLTSLVSVASANVVSASTVEGELSLNIHYEPSSSATSPDATAAGSTRGGGNKGKGRVAGHVHVTVREGRSLAGKDTYVKLYLSERGKNVRSSKHKTRVQRRTHNPVFQQSFKMPIGTGVALDDDTRLQVTVWDHSRMRTNECLGAMSFSLLEIASTTTIMGWFQLLPYEQGRVAHTAGTASVRSSPRASKGNLDSSSITSGASGSSNTATNATGALLRRQQQQQQQQQQQSQSARSVDGMAPTTSGTTISSAVSGDSGGGRKRKPLFGGGGKARQKEVQELRQQMVLAEANEQRHVTEKAMLEEKLQRLREDHQRQVESLEQQVRELSGTSGSSQTLLEEKEELEVENARLHKMLELMQADAREHRDQISSLRDRVGDLTTEIRGLRAWKTALVDEVLRLDPKAFTRASIAIANSMNE